MSVERWMGHMITARQYFSNSQETSLFPNVRAQLAAQSAEYALKAVYYYHFPDRDISGHISKQLVGNVCYPTKIAVDPLVVNAAGRLEPHYEASKYVEETTKEFSCANMQVGCWHYGEVIDGIISDAELIIKWASAQLQK